MCVAVVILIYNFVILEKNSSRSWRENEYIVIIVMYNDLCNTILAILIQRMM